MRNTIKFFGIIAFIAIIGFSFISCDESFGHPAVSISGEARVGEQFTATSTGRGWSDGLGFEWMSANTADPNLWLQRETRVGSGSTFTIPSGMSGQFIRARRWNNSENAHVYSRIVGPISN